MIIAKNFKVLTVIFLCLAICVSVFAGSNVCALADGESGGVVNGNVENGGADEKDYGRDPMAMLIGIAVFLVCLFFVGEAIFTAVKKHKKARAEQFSRE